MWSARCFFVCKTFVSREKEKKVFDASVFFCCFFPAAAQKKNEPKVFDYLGPKINL